MVDHAQHGPAPDPAQWQRTITVIPHRPSRRQRGMVLLAILLVALALTNRIWRFCAGFRIRSHRSRAE